MRRILSIALVLLMSLPLVAPALGQTAPQGLLLCCRKGGAHHCMTLAAMGDMPPTSTIRLHCPANPKPAVTSLATDGMVGSGHATFAQAGMNELSARPVEAGYRVAFQGSRQKRGPPMKLLT